MTGVHTCDRRSQKSVIQNVDDSIRFENSFTKNDELWFPNEREPSEDVATRMQKLLDDIFNDDDSFFISFTSHALAIAALLRVLNHREFKVVTGSTISILVKAEFKNSENSTSVPAKPAFMPFPFRKFRKFRKLVFRA